jgi:hypothetical protein
MLMYRMLEALLHVHKAVVSRVRVGSSEMCLGPEPKAENAVSSRVPK